MTTVVAVTAIGLPAVTVTALLAMLSMLGDQEREYASGRMYELGF